MISSLLFVGISALAVLAITEDEDTMEISNYVWSNQLCFNWLANEDNGECIMKWHEGGTEVCPATHSFCTQEDDASFSVQLHLPFLKIIGGVDKERFVRAYMDFQELRPAELMVEYYDLCIPVQEAKEKVLEAYEQLESFRADLLIQEYELAYEFYASAYCLACSPTEGEAIPHVKPNIVDEITSKCYAACDTVEKYTRVRVELDSTLECHSDEQKAQDEAEIQEIVAQCRSVCPDVMDSLNGFQYRMSDLFFRSGTEVMLPFAPLDVSNDLEAIKDNSMIMRFYAKRQAIKEEPTSYVIDEEGYDMVEGYSGNHFKQVYDELHPDGSSEPAEKTGLGAGDIAAIILAILLIVAIVGIVVMFLRTKRTFGMKKLDAGRDISA